MHLAHVLPRLCRKSAAKAPRPRFDHWSAASLIAHLSNTYLPLGSGELSSMERNLLIDATMEFLNSEDADGATGLDMVAALRKHPFRCVRDFFDVCASGYSPSTGATFAEGKVVEFVDAQCRPLWEEKRTFSDVLSSTVAAISGVVGQAALVFLSIAARVAAGVMVLVSIPIFKALVVGPVGTVAEVRVAFETGFAGSVAIVDFLQSVHAPALLLWSCALLSLVWGMFHVSRS